MIVFDFNSLLFKAILPSLEKIPVSIPADCHGLLIPGPVGCIHLSI